MMKSKPQAREWNRRCGQALPAVTGTMANAQKGIAIYLAAKSARDRSNFADLLVLDGFNASMFPSPSALWDAFRIRPVRFVVTERRFPRAWTA